MIDTREFYPDSNPGCDYERSMFGAERLFEFLFSNFEINVFCEIGSYVGGGVNKLLSIKSSLFICAIDLWENEEMVQLLKGDKQNVTAPEAMSALYDELAIHPLYESFLSNVWQHKDQILPLRMESLEGLHKLKELGVYPDVVFIDASHQYLQTKNELYTADELFPNAIICGDDYSDTYTGVISAVNEFNEDRGYELQLFDRGFLIKKS